MKLPRTSIQIADLSVDVVRKRMKNLYVRVYPPDGRVCVSAPLRASEDVIRRAILDRSGWIRKHQDRLTGMAQRPEYHYRSGELHEVFGRPVRLEVTEVTGVVGTAVGEDGDTLNLWVRPGSTRERRAAILSAWYRDQLTALAQPMMQHWAQRIGVEPRELRTRRMRTRWGTCNVDARRIWLNLELARRPEALVEYVMVHELVHLLERRHNRRFYDFMDRYLPDWRERRTQLNQILL